MNYFHDLKQRLLNIAKTDTAKYPQYAGHYDGWILGMATKTVKYKGGSFLIKGRIVLASPDLGSFHDPDTGHDCGTPAKSLIKV